MAPVRTKDDPSSGYAHRFFRLKTDVASKITGNQDDYYLRAPTISGNAWSELVDARRAEIDSSNIVMTNPSSETGNGDPSPFYPPNRAIEQHLFGAGVHTVPPKLWTADMGEPEFSKASPLTSKTANNSPRQRFPAAAVASVASRVEDHAHRVHNEIALHQHAAVDSSHLDDTHARALAHAHARVREGNYSRVGHVEQDEDRQTVIKQQQIYRHQLDEQVRANRHRQRLEEAKSRDRVPERGIFGNAGWDMLKPHMEAPVAATWDSSHHQQAYARPETRDQTVQHSKSRRLSRNPSASDMLHRDHRDHGQHGDNDEEKRVSGTYVCGMWFEETQQERASKDEKRKKLKQDLELQMAEKERRRRIEMEENQRWEERFGQSTESLPWLSGGNGGRVDDVAESQQTDPSRSVLESSAPTPYRRREAFERRHSSEDSSPNASTNAKGVDTKQQQKVEIVTPRESATVSALNSSTHVSIPEFDVDNFFAGLTLKKPALLHALNWTVPQLRASEPQSHQSGCDLQVPQERIRSENTEHEPAVMNSAPIMQKSSDAQESRDDVGFKEKDQGHRQPKEDGTSLKTESVFVSAPAVTSELASSTSQNLQNTHRPAADTAAYDKTTNPDTIDNLLLNFLNQPVHLGGSQPQNVSNAIPF